MVQRRTNKGQIIDLDKIFASQSSRPTVGNMKTNANGDVIDNNAEVVQPAEERVREYYKDHPTSSLDQQSIKGTMPNTGGSVNDPGGVEVKTAKTQKENIRTQKVQPDPEPEAPKGESFEEQEPLGYKEYELPNGDIEMVPYYTQEEAPDGNKGDTG